ncbi:Ltp family lipoprotein [Candidatus Microthrix parvicella]|uniref:Ltp family lipoprotein n=2 Tax=Candidatus Neomicrothrix TaxID=41949 RepID=UPI001930D901|nr:Ltp family lipoprotein [Candidatus Microthrix parvicella]
MSDQAQGPGWWQASDGKWYPPQTAAQPFPSTAQGLPVASAANPGSGDLEAGKQTPWYERTWVLALSLLFCFPIGLILLWVNKRFTPTTKIIVTAVVLALALIAGIADSLSPPDESKEAKGAATSEAQTTAKPTTTAPPATTAKPTTTAAPATTAKPTTTAAPASTAKPTTTAPPATTAKPTTTPPPTTAPPPPKTAPPPTQPALSVSEQQAVRAAQSYLDYSGFSRQGLIDQLSSEYGDQFNVRDATAAVDSLTVDYNAEAVESARSYLEFSSFSCQGLIDQLSSQAGDQFTVDQATFAAGQTGLC